MDKDFMQKGVQLSHSIAFMILEESFISNLWRVSLAEYILVLRVPFLYCFTDGQMYYGYCINYLYPAMGDDLTKDNGHSTSSFAFVEMIRLWHYNELSVCTFETEMLPVLLNLVCNNYIWTSM